MELSHIFVFASPSDVGILAGFGLAESFRRVHPGQGTNNVSYCFDNSYLELLFVDDEGALGGLVRTGLLERSGWRQSRASPFGIAVRSVDDLPFATWDYRPVYLPKEVVISVDRGSDDIEQPFIFRTPGDRRPDQWTNGLAGGRQSTVGLLEIISIDLYQPQQSGAALRGLEGAGIVRVHPGASSHKMVVGLTRSDGSTGALTLPDFYLD
jgi:hypothetical protein